MLSITLLPADEQAREVICFHSDTTLGLILTTVEGRMYVVVLAKGKAISTVVSLENNTPSTSDKAEWSFETLYCFNARHPVKEDPTHIDVILLGIVMEVRPEQSLNAYAPIEVTLSGMITELRLEQLSNACLPMDVTSSGM